MNVPIFTREDIASQTWAKLNEELTARLQKYRVLNDGEFDPIATAKIRGRISELKALLALADSQARATGGDGDE